LVLATSAVMAAREAIASARKDAGLTEFFQIETPLTVDRLQAACGVDISQLAV
jgi:hypothetical protein